MENLQCLTCIEKHKNGILESELKLQKEKLEKQIAMLKDGLEYQKNQADTFAKALVKVYDLIEELLDGDEDIIPSDLKTLKNSIPETALKRV